MTYCICMPFHSCTRSLMHGRLVPYFTLSMHRFAPDPPSTRLHSPLYMVPCLTWCRRLANGSVRQPTGQRQWGRQRRSAHQQLVGPQQVNNCAVSVPAPCRCALSLRGEVAEPYGDRGWEIQGCVCEAVTCGVGAWVNLFSIARDVRVFVVLKG